MNSKISTINFNQKLIYCPYNEAEHKEESDQPRKPPLDGNILSKYTGNERYNHKTKFVNRFTRNF